MTRPLRWLLLLASIAGGVHWFLYARPVSHPAVALAPDAPTITLDARVPAWSDAHGFRYRALGRFTGQVVVVGRRNYALGEFAALAPTDLAIAWGPLSDPRTYAQFAFDQRGSPLSGRYVFPEIRRDSAMAGRPFAEVEAFLLANLTHVHAIPATPRIASALSGIRPGQVVRFEGWLVEVVARSGERYASSLKLHDYDCEIAWIDTLELVD